MTGTVTVREDDLRLLMEYAGKDIPMEDGKHEVNVALARCAEALDAKDGSEGERGTGHWPHLRHGAHAGCRGEGTCPLPGCGAVLRIEVSRSGVVYADGTADADLTSTWYVGCEQGHVLLLPPDTAEDYYEYDESASGRLRDLLASVFT